MESFILSILGWIPILCALFLFYKLLRFGHREKGLPPGPPTIPILGNAHQLASSDLSKKFKEWSDQYGGIFSLKVGAGTFIVLNDRRAVHDLIDKKSAIYADRPLDANVDAAMRGENFAVSHATPLWRAARKIASQNLSPKALDEKIMPIQEAETFQLAYDLLTTPKDFSKHIKRTTASTSSIVAFGHRAPTYDSFWVQSVYTAMDDHINPTMEPGTYLPIEQFPILKYIPDQWAPSKARANRCYEAVTAIWTEGLEKVKERCNNGDQRVSLADRMLSGDLKSDVPMTPTVLANFLGSITQGGADTTSSGMRTNVLHLAKHPWVQKKAQAELDRVCGTERMPRWTDFKDLPFINCIIKEGLRIRPVVPTGVPHRNNRDDWFDGYLIPKDSTVFFNHWGIHHTSEFYDDPEAYNPDRYLDHPRLANDYAGSPDYMNRDHYAYGAGRRICVGIHLAERTLWRITAMMLWGFEIEPAITDDGEEEKLDLGAYVAGFMTQPETFNVRFTPRSEKHAEVIRTAFENSKEYLKQWE